MSEWKSVGEWLKAVMTAEKGGPVDPRLPLDEPAEPSFYTGEELLRLMGAVEKYTGTKLPPE